MVKLGCFKDEEGETFKVNIHLSQWCIRPKFHRISRWRSFRLVQRALLSSLRFTSFLSVREVLSHSSVPGLGPNYNSVSERSRPLGQKLLVSDGELLSGSLSDLGYLVRYWFDHCSQSVSGVRRS